MQARRLSPSACTTFISIYAYICVSTPRGEKRAKAKSNEAVLLFALSRGKGKRVEDLTKFYPFRIYESSILDHEASIFRLRKWMNPPPPMLSSISLLSLTINVISLEMHCIIVLHSFSVISLPSLSLIHSPYE